MTKWITIALLCCGAAFAQSSFGGGQVRSTGTITAGHCASFVSATKIQDSGAACGGGAGTINPNNGIAGANAFYAAAGGSTTISPASGLSYDSVGNATLAQGTIAVSTPAWQNTVTLNAGAVAFTEWLQNITCTAAATASIAAGWGTAGTQWQLKYGAANCASPQFLVPNGATANPAIAASGSTNTGLYFNGGTGPVITSAGTDIIQFGISSQIRATSADSYCWSSSTPTGAGCDTGFFRSAPAIVNCGNGNSLADTSCRFRAAGFMSLGTTFTSNAGCGDTTLTGGATAGKYTSVTAGTCTTVITMGNTATAPNGWSCTATDLTTAADAGNIKQTATTTTTASLNETTVAANDVIQFSCIGY